ncbi:hypothetical protein GCM10009639_03970 [Kitasatospora putterlickiae]|uniref:ABC transporter permease n=1 Tax=Kitasatospora putterlickiae TaxID=221725 RepID=A0ABP4IAW5_9ACTN
MTPALRGVVLHLRSRSIPATGLVFLAAAAFTWAGYRADDPGVAQVVGLIAAVLGVASVARTLAGPDEELERGTPVRWRLVRTLHLTLLGGVLLGVLATVHAVADRPTHAVPPVGLALAVTALTGLTALSAALFGAQAAWVPPIGWALLMVATGPRPSVFEQVLTWMVQEPRTTASTATALTLAVLGTLAYALRGSRH